jgi:uncharacterized protein (DUF2141 family)
MVKAILLSLATVLFPGASFPGDISGTGQFVLHIENIEQQKGTIQVALFASEDAFLKDELACYAESVAVKGKGNQTFSLPNLPVGQYAIAIYHDLNQDGELNTNLWGIPTEPYAFSRTPENKWKKPTFGSTWVRLTSGRNEVHMELKRWKHL